MHQKPKLNFFLWWPVIIVGFIVFWPIGIVLLLFRIYKDKTAALRVGQILKVISYILFGLLAFVLLGLIMSGNTNDIEFFYYLVAFTFAIYMISMKLISDSRKTKQYMTAIINNHERDINNIAHIFNKPIDKVSKDVQKLIDQGLLKGAVINQSTHTIILPQDHTNVAHTTVKPDSEIDSTQPAEMINSFTRIAVSFQQAAAQQQAAQQQASQPRVAQCKFCGANNSVSNTTGECEYCGSPL